MLKLYSAANLQEAYLMLHLLAAEGIQAKVLNEHTHGALGEIPFIHAYPEIWLQREDDLPRAREVVATFGRDPGAFDPVACPACGEENPGNFETCWHCGRSIE